MQPDIPAPAPTEEATPIGPGRAFVVRTPRRTWGVPLVLVLNVAVYSAMVLAGVSWTEPNRGDLLRFGASHGPTIAGGDWWRLVACAFVHIGFVHFMVNMAGLFALRIVESFYGSGAFLLLYLMSATGASACSVLWHPGMVSAGASGALFGLAGALLVYFVGHRHAIPDLFFKPVLRNLILLLALLLFLGALMDGVDNVAHLGGLATGLIAGRALDRDPQGCARLDSRRLARASIPAILLGLLCMLVPWRASSAADIRLELATDEAQRQLVLGHSAEALRVAEEGLARDPAHPDLLAVRARIRYQNGDPRAALDGLNQLLYLRPENIQGRFLRANILRELGRFEDALDDAQRLVKESPDDPRMRQLAGETCWCLGRFQEAAFEFGQLARRRSGNVIEGQLFLWLARCRLGDEEPATRELRHYLALPRLSEESALDVSVAGLFAGQGSLDELLASFDRRGTTPGDLARLNAFAGLWKQSKGDLKSAREFLHKCADESAAPANLRLLARHELEELEKH